ncbi:MAG: DUF6576 domain-containing protein, partial [Thermoleophilia bacterium]
FQVNLGRKEELRVEVDRILDKINSQGFGALTAEEKRRLDEAKDLLRKIWEWWDENGRTRERVAELIERLGLRTFLRAGSSHSVSVWWWGRRSPQAPRLAHTRSVRLRRPVHS